MIRLTRRYRFSASHRLHAAGLSQEENRELYGKCNNPFGHGHDYVLDVSVCGPVEERSGTVMRLSDLDGIVQEKVVRALDHRNLNVEVPEFESMTPTTESLAFVIGCRLRKDWPAGWPRLDTVRLEETKNNRIELRTANP
ncbi:MAG: 6-carboxytetrahydropterin synthase [Bryobacteraceae bacterium]|nr:6-carboxytetrahydropterin synthase [Bryobacterales bacterium]MEB2360503.1 6-carboxytetrahydropterin synthase [Bryobacterales bacterium]NUN02987.1 6-carboxytetrahydropterin synthase [Bryobacteraceae bacterium]